MRLYYIAPSPLPTRAANAVHVLMQCQAFAEKGVDVTVFAARAIEDERLFYQTLSEDYKVDKLRHRIRSFCTPSQRALSLRIGLWSVWQIVHMPEPDAILSRNLYASFILGVLMGRKILFETHQLETGFRKILQRMIMTRPKVVTIVISNKLTECLTGHHGIAPRQPLVFHDAAPEGEPPCPPQNRRSHLWALFPAIQRECEAVCGYFGHLYPGRGIEIIEGMAAKFPRSLFLVFGGNGSDVKAWREKNKLDNLVFMGHVPHTVAQRAMRYVDILLMPYQKQVSIGVSGHDTARWMSPMKMFEYMAAGVPVIASDLPALREVLRHEENAMLAEPSSVNAWSVCLSRLLMDPVFAHRIAQNAHGAFLSHYTWRKRAAGILEAARERV